MTMAGSKIDSSKFIIVKNLPLNDKSLTANVKNGLDTSHTKAVNRAG